MENGLNNYLGNESVTVFSSLDSQFAVSDALTGSIGITRNRLLISSPWIGKSFIDLLRKTVPHGVSVNLLTRLRSQNNDNSSRAIESLHEVAESCGWKIDARCVSNHHPKFLVIDDSACLVGSLNPTEAGLYYNLELGFLIRIPRIVERVRDFFFKMQRMSSSWKNVKQFRGFKQDDNETIRRKIAEKYMGLFLSNGNTPLPKWKTCSELKRMGFAEYDIISVESNLMNRGILYEPKVDWVCLVRS